MPDAWDVAREILWVLLALVLVLFLAWAALRWLNNRIPGLGGGGAQRSIRVLDRVALGKNSAVLLLRVKDRVLLVAVSENAVEKLAEFNADEGGFEAPALSAPPSFSSALRDAVSKMGIGKKGGGEGT